MKHIVGHIVRSGIMGLLLLTLFTTSCLAVTAHAQAAQMSSATAYLMHAPHGSANLQWSPQTQALTVTILLGGLQQNTRHPAHIHTGSCPSDGSILYTLNDVIADAAGNGVSITTISNVMQGIPATGWHINVHSGPTLAAAAEALPITCGNILNSQPSTQAYQSINVPLANVAQPNQNAYGFVYLSLIGTTLNVKAVVFHLVPGSSHAFHIHAGSCEQQVPGNILYPLTTLTADGSGQATSTTIVQGIKAIPATGWYLNVHFGTNLSIQSSFDPIACGNVIVPNVTKK